MNNALAALLGIVLLVGALAAVKGWFEFCWNLSNGEDWGLALLLSPILLIVGAALGVAVFGS